MDRWTRDPDLGRNRETKALGRRDWNWFQPHTGSTGAGASPADTEPAQSPWAGHPIMSHDRHDRTLGIPPRNISMWPSQPGKLNGKGDWSANRTAEQIADDLRWLHQPPPPPDIPTDRLVAALTDVAASAYGRPPSVQELILIRTAIDHGIDLGALTESARGVGTMIAKTTHRSTSQLSGEPALNALAGANLAVATETYLARIHITRATIRSDPDLPRLWMLANALTHRIPAHTILAVPGRSHGPIAQIRPTHDDLVGWRGVSSAVGHLIATLEAVRRGHHWLATAASNDSNRLLALGLLDLTQPTNAARLAARAPGVLNLDQIRALVARRPAPTAITDLSDPALKAICDRNGWLHGTPDERTARELIERRIPLNDPDRRARLARGDMSALAGQFGRTPADVDLDRGTWRNHPPAADAVHVRQLLNIASREVMGRFSNLDVIPRLTRADAIAGRYPDRIGSRLLRLEDPERILLTDTPPPEPPRPPQAELDLGL